MIDRIYDTFIDEDELRVCDLTVAEIADSLPPRPYSSREFLLEMGRYLDERGKDFVKPGRIVFVVMARGAIIRARFVLFMVFWVLTKWKVMALYRRNSL